LPLPNNIIGKYTIAVHVPYTAYGELILSWEAYGANCISLTITQTDVYFTDLGKHGLSWVKEEVENICLVVKEI